jgi:hypothetical protein
LTRATARNHPAGASPQFSEKLRAKNLSKGYLYYSFEFEAKEITRPNSRRRWPPSRRPGNAQGEGAKRIEGTERERGTYQRQDPISVVKSRVFLVHLGVFHGGVSRGALSRPFLGAGLSRENRRHPPVAVRCPPSAGRQPHGVHTGGKKPWISNRSSCRETPEMTPRDLP